jgi:hypothetical protein
MHVHQGEEVPRMLSGQILIRCRDRRRTARLVRRAPLPGNPERPYLTAAASSSRRLARTNWRPEHFWW